MSDTTPNVSSVQLPLFDPIEIRLTKGYVTLVDPIDADLAEYRWHAIMSWGRAYAFHSVSSKRVIGLHRVILERILGRDLASGEQVDHRDNDPLNNRRENLRVATPVENSRNRKRRSTNTSGYKGVSFVRGKWYAQISVNRHNISLGYFDTPEEAHAAYCEAARKYHGEFARFE